MAFSEALAECIRQRLAPAQERRGEEEVWRCRLRYPVNAYAAKRLLVVRLVISIGGLLLFLVAGVDLFVYALANAGIGLVGLLSAVIQGFLYFRSFPGSPQGEEVSSDRIA